ncbi:SpoIIE family protein phosphatase [Streptomyces sp. NPDC091281]|uniref:SpoIIE family protein phosphatase n=1 Tax=Streptomyces sp. NPDC091281 TaxID=3365985 RepID=UPI00381FD549
MAPSEDAQPPEADRAPGEGGRRSVPPGPSPLLASGDEVGGDLARVDWRATPLGPPEEWPQSLRTAVGILLSSRFAMWMAWGPELTFFCNAAYRRDTLGRKYPWALGRPAREVWAEVWHDVEDRIASVLTTGRATWDEALPLFLERSGYPEETYHTFSYSPLRDDAGAVVGMLCVVSEETERVVGGRRMTTLRDLGSGSGGVRTEREVLDGVGAHLGRNPYDLPFTLTYLYDGDGTARLAGATGLPAGHPAAPAVLPAAPSASGPPRLPWPPGAAEGDGTDGGEPVLVALDGPTFAALPRGERSAPPTRALVVPLVPRGGAPYGFLVAGLNPHRPPDESYRGFVALVAGHLASGLAGARSHAAQERRTAELTELDRAKTAFFSNVSHELRTPLALIMGPVEELRAGPAGADPVAREELDVIHRNALRLGKLVNSLLDFARIEAGRTRARFEPVDLSAVTAELAGVFRSAVERAGLTLEVDCPPLDEPVHVDRGMWEKVVLNLLSNALKFTFEGTIRLTVRAGEAHAVVTVEDTGVGVPAAEMPRLFERFHRIENTRSRSHEGSGIGLALVKELVLLHGGTIDAASEEDAGTRFTVRLPRGTGHLPADARVTDAAPAEVADGTAPYVQEALRWLPGPGAATAPAPEAAARPHEAAPGSAVRVLVADDNADLREYLTRILRGAGYAVDAVADGRAALGSARTRAPDLVVSDVMMPHLDGLSLVAALRADPRTASVPVLLLSARAGEEASVEGLRAGADDYLVKPFASAELLARVRANVELARLRTHHVRWRDALIDSLQEAFFVCAEDGSVIETNAAFADILGYGADGLPYPPRHPWWPDAAADPEAHRRAADVFEGLTRRGRGRHTVPVDHRDGHRVWISVAFNQVRDPETGRRVAVGTFRDVTAEHHAARREAALAALGVVLSEAADSADALTGALDELRGLWSARRVLAVLFEDRAEPAVTATGSPPAWAQLSGAEREALADLRDRPPLTPVSGPTAMDVVLEHPRGSLVVRVERDHERRFTAEDHLLLSLLAGRLAQGLVRAHQIDRQRETAVALQRAILGPAHLPDGFAVRYEPAARPLEVGGDWYDTVPLADGRIGIVVGDCVGHGLEAASVMGQLRSACRALLLQNGSPAQTLTALDHFAAGVPGALCTTVFCGVLDPATGRMTYSSAGHPPGIVAPPPDAQDRTVLLEGGRSLPLAVRPGRPRPEASYVLPGRSTLLLFTDGLVERRRQPLDVSIRQAEEALREGRTVPVTQLAEHLMRRLAPGTGYEDDVALLLYRHPAPLEISFPAESSQLAPVRRALRGWLERCDLSTRDLQDMLIGAGEACANAIEHGHRDAPGGTVRLRADSSFDELRLSVADSGSWRAPRAEPHALRGRGLLLMRSLMRDVTVTADATGTTVEMTKRITP